MFAIGHRVRVVVQHGQGQWTDHGPGLVLAVSKGVNTVYTVRLDSGGVPRVFGGLHLSGHIDREPEVGTVLCDPSATYWLKKALQECVKRDACDAAADAELLGRILRQRANDALGRVA